MYFLLWVNRLDPTGLQILFPQGKLHTEEEGIRYRNIIGKVESLSNRPGGSNERVNVVSRKKEERKPHLQVIMNIATTYGYF